MTKKSKCLVTEENRREIVYNLINSSIAGIISLASIFIANGEFTFKAVIIAFCTSLLVMATKFKEYWDGEKNEYTKVFNFVTM